MYLEYKLNYIWWDTTCIIHTNNMDLKWLKNGAAASPLFDLVTCVSVVALQGTVTLDINRLRTQRKQATFFISVLNQIHAQNLFYNKFYFMPLHVSSTCAHHQDVKIALHSLWCDDTRGCVMQF